MSLNPVSFAAQVNEQFLRYQLTSHPLADERLAKQTERMVRGEALRGSPLVKGPYLSLSKPFLTGAAVADLVGEGALHPAMQGILGFPALFQHQLEVLRSAQAGRHTLVATGTGSGKTEAFLAPILDHCLRLRDAGAPEGIVAVLVYPMNALAQDQKLRLRRMLRGTGISFGMYVGSTPSAPEKVLEPRDQIPDEERPSEKEMRERPPRLLITNYRQLEILLTRGADQSLWEDPPLRYLVFDEAHTYSGVLGAEVSCLIRRLRTFCGKNADEVLCIGTSATIADPESGEEAGREFAHRFFGVSRERVDLVGERYAEYEWAAELMDEPPAPRAGDELLVRALDAVRGDGDARAVEAVARVVLGAPLRLGEDWREDLFGWMQRSRLVRTLAELLEKPAHLEDAVDRLAESLGREVQDRASARAEVLAVLALGAAAQRSGGSLLRPKVHHFAEGLQGVVGLLPAGEETPRLFMTREEAAEQHAEHLPSAIWSLFSCETCGQHFFESWVESDGPALAEGDNAIHPPSDDAVGERWLWTDRFDVEERAQDEAASERLESRREETWICRFCGAFHRYGGTNCANPKCGREGGLFRAHQVLLEEGKLTSCPVCISRGGRWAEPIRRFRAATTADNHILAQDMLQAAARPEAQKLLVFTDNRQDAAFQAGWMADRARRYRMRHLMLQFLREAGRPLSVGDFVAAFQRLFAADRALSRALCPEVYEHDSDEAFSTRLDEELRAYLRIQVLLEWTPGLRNRSGLEVLGVVRAVYAGLPDEGDAWLRSWSEAIGCKPAALLDGIRVWLDTVRRKRSFWDDAQPIFSKRYFGTADSFVSRGYLPATDGPPLGLVLRKTEDPAGAKVEALWSPRGSTNFMHQARGWGVPAHRMEQFAGELWRNLTQGWLHEGRPLLAEAPLVGTKGSRLPGTIGARQLDSRLVGLELADGRWACSICHRIHARPTPRLACTRHHCRGRLAPSPVPEDHYDFANLRRDFTMLMPREHSAQVPAEERYQIEETFRKTDGDVNCLVATPTLELGVDIGGLDMVLLRNVPPTPANYWQRVGRAGRQERMAVLYTYCRAAQHDRYFFEDPMRLLAGKVVPPRFNLRNPVMVRKHLHAAVMSEFLRAMRPSDAWGLGEERRLGLAASWKQWFPIWQRQWLMDDQERYLTQAPDLSAFAAAVHEHRSRLLEAVVRTFQPDWPEEDADVVAREILARLIGEMPARLRETAELIHRRFQWANETLARLYEEKRRGKLEREQDYQLRRCEAFQRSMLTTENPANYLLTVLAAEGFLPGYNELEAGVTAWAGRHRQAGRFQEEFPLRRAASLAVREYVPGNRIYANRGQFRLEHYRFPAESAAFSPVECVVETDPERPEVRERDRVRAGYASDTTVDLLALPISDCQLGYSSRIHDQELDRFRLPVTVLGYLREQHRGGENLQLGRLQVQHLRGQGVKLVNVGATEKIREGVIGYRVCGGCGAVRSPFETPESLRKFEEFHKPHWPRIATPVGLSADVDVDGWRIRSPEVVEMAPLTSVAEAIRRGAARVLEMNETDLQILPLVSGGSVEAFLYDPMPGGSGLLDLVRRNWCDVRAAAIELCRECPGACERSCYECLRDYRNSFLHAQLDRSLALDLLEDAEDFVLLNPIPPARSSGPSGGGSNQYERRLQDWIEGAGLPQPLSQRTIEFEQPVHFGSERIASTTPDFVYYRGEHGADIAIYEDGSPHDRQERRFRDRAIRDELMDRGWTVVEVHASELTDEARMRRHIQRIERRLRQP